MSDLHHRDEKPAPAPAAAPKKPLGIEKTLEVFADLETFSIAGVKIARSFAGGLGLGFILSSLTKIVALAKSVEELVKDVPGALPELADLSAEESAKIGAASFELVRKIVAAIADRG